jgi:hypothetical protein
MQHVTREDTIITIKMRTGEEIVAKLNKPLDDELDYVFISFPLVLMNTPQGLGMAPYLITIDMDTEINLPKSTIAVVLESSKSAKNQYFQALEGMADSATV